MDKSKYVLYVGLGVDLRCNGVLIECGTRIGKSGGFFLGKCDYSQLTI